MGRGPPATQPFTRTPGDRGMSLLTKRIPSAKDMGRVVKERRRIYFSLLALRRAVPPPLFNQLAPGVCPLFYPMVVENKPALLENLRGRGIDAIDFWKYFHPACDASQFPEVAELRRTILEIPCHQDFGPEAMAEIADAVRDALVQTRPQRSRAG